MVTIRSCRAKHFRTFRARDQSEAGRKACCEYSNHCKLYDRSLNEVKADDRSEQKYCCDHDSHNVNDLGNRGFVEAAVEVSIVSYLSLCRCQSIDAKFLCVTHLLNQISPQKLREVVNLSRRFQRHEVVLVVQKCLCFP